MSNVKTLKSGQDAHLLRQLCEIVVRGFEFPGDLSKFLVEADLLWYFFHEERVEPNVATLFRLPIEVVGFQGEKSLQLGVEGNDLTPRTHDWDVLLFRVSL